MDAGEFRCGINDLLSLGAITFNPQGIKSKLLVEIKICDAGLNAGAYYFRAFWNQREQVSGYFAGAGSVDESLYRGYERGGV